MKYVIQAIFMITQLPVVIETLMWVEIISCVITNIAWRKPNIIPFECVELTVLI